MKIPNDSTALRMMFGFILLAILAGLATAIALGKVEEKTSYGLMPLLVGISNLATQFASWAFAPANEHRDDPPKTPAVTVE